VKRREWRPRFAIVITAILCVTLAGHGNGPAQTDAAWTDAENARGAFTAGFMTNVTGLTCTSGLLSPIRLSWPAPVGLPALTGYRWTVTGGLTASGNLPASATSMTLNTGGLITIGSGVFSLYAVSNNWESPTPARANVAFLNLVLGVTSSCTPQ
jgi:hypothetical protein